MTIKVPESLPMQTRLAPVADGAIDAAARTVTVTFTTGAAVRRRRWTGWDSSVPFDEILQVSDTAIDLGRLNAGAPALDSHSFYTSRSQVGVVEKAWIDGGEGRATIRFPSEGLDESSDRMFGLVSERIIRNVSVGYSVDRAKRFEAEKKGEVERYVVERWTPQEISFVTIPADPGAQVRSGGEQYPFLLVAPPPSALAATRMRLRAALFNRF